MIIIFLIVLFLIVFFKDKIYSNYFQIINSVLAFLFNIMCLMGIIYDPVPSTIYLKSYFLVIWFIFFIKNILDHKNKFKISYNINALILLHIPILNEPKLIIISLLLYSALVFDYVKNFNLKKSYLFYFMFYLWVGFNWIYIDLDFIYLVIEFIISIILLKEYIRFVSYENSSFIFAILTTLLINVSALNYFHIPFLIIHFIVTCLWLGESLDLGTGIKKIILKNHYLFKLYLKNIPQYKEFNYKFININKPIIEKKYMDSEVFIENDLRLNFVSILFLILMIILFVLYGTSV